MAQEFHLRLITERAGGGDPIVRERRVAGPQATIGRATDSDIVLTDLTIDPNHATIRFTGPGRVAVESVSGLPFTVDGRSTQRAELDAAAKPELVFANYHLVFEPAEDGGVTIVVTHPEHEHHPSPSVFSLQAKVFGRRNMAWVFGVTIFVVCLLVPLVGAGLFSHLKIHPDEQWSSGPLSKAHAFLEKDCRSCHTNAFVAVRDQACLSCHQLSGDSAGLHTVRARAKDLGSPFEPILVVDHADHKKLEKAARPDKFWPGVSAAIQGAFNHPTERCASCHVEHTKARALTGDDPHAPVTDKPTLVPVKDCQGCHANLSKKVKTALADTPDWGKHPQFTPALMTAAGQKPILWRADLKEPNGLTFSHQQHLDPVGGVARQAIELGRGAGYGAPLQCVSCHQHEGTGFKPVEMKQACGACHSLAYARVNGQLVSYPHGSIPNLVAWLDRGITGAAAAGPDRQRPGSIRPTSFGSPQARATLASLTRPGGQCVECHTFTWPADGGLPVSSARLSDHYMAKGGFDHSIPEHGQPEKAKGGQGFRCEDCHAARTSTNSADLLIPGIETCRDCHTTAAVSKPHAVKAKTDCAECHSFHKPGVATPPRGHPPLAALRWSEATEAKPAA